MSDSTRRRVLYCCSFSCVIDRKILSIATSMMDSFVCLGYCMNQTIHQQLLYCYGHKLNFQITIIYKHALASVHCWSLQPFISMFNPYHILFYCVKLNLSLINIIRCWTIIRNRLKFDIRGCNLPTPTERTHDYSIIHQIHSEIGPDTLIRFMRVYAASDGVSIPVPTTCSKRIREFKNNWYDIMIVVASWLNLNGPEIRVISDLLDDYKIVCLCLCI